MPLEKDVTRVREGEEENDGRFRVKSALLERGIVGATTNVNRVSRGPAETAAKPVNATTELANISSISHLSESVRACLRLYTSFRTCVCRYRCNQWSHEWICA